MQNFTLGKKGYAMLLFALTLLIGSSPTYGQTDDCPTETGTLSSQTFCFLATVEDIASDGTAIFQTANNTDTQPIPDSELLANGTYFAGSTSSDCARIGITVTVNNAPRPVNRITNSRVSGFEFTTCTPASFNSANLAKLFVAQPNYSIEVYDSEESTSPIADGTVLNTGNSYFVGQIPNGTEDASSNTCPSLRVAVGFNPNQINPPVAETPQIFCENATVADLVAQGTYDDTQAIRWYRSLTANSPLSDDTQLINGQTYFAAQVVNERGSILPPCETPADDRTPVMVEITETIVINSPEPGEVCETDVQETFPSVNAIENFYLSLLAEGTPTNGTFDPTAAQLAEMFQNDADGLGDFTTTYTVGEGNCESSVDLTINIVAAEVATLEPIENDTVCASPDGLDLSTYVSTNTMGGTFTSSNGTITGTTLDISEDGVFNITYTVDESDSTTCLTGNVSEDFTITVGGTELGEPIVLERCIIEVEGFQTNPAAVIALYNDALAERGITDLSGTFTPGLDVVGAQIIGFLENPTLTETFETIYSVSTDCGDDSVLISLTINNTTAPNAGEITPAPVCSSATPFDLNSLLGENNDQGGTFTDENNAVITDGLFDVSEMGTFDITYTVTESDENCTAGDPDATTFTLNVNEGVVAQSPENTIVCESDVQTLFPSVDEIRKFYVAIAQRAGFPTNGTISPTGTQLAAIYQDDEDGLGEFTTTYTFGNGTCQTSVELTVEIVPTEEATVEPIENDTVCASENGLDLSTYVSTNTMRGTFTSSNGTITGTTLDISEDGVFNITYTIDESDSTTCLTGNVSEDFTITVGGTELGEPIVLERCIIEIRELTLAEATALFNDALEERGITDLDGTFTPGINVVGAQILAYLANPTPSQTFETTYSVSTDCGEDSVSISLTINDTTAPNAGEITPAPVCSSSNPFDLNTLLGDNNDAGGTFSNENGNVITGGLFDVSEMGTFDITYTVTESDENCTAGDPDITTFTLTVSEGTTLPSPEAAIVCEADVDALFPSFDEIRKYYLNLLPTGTPRNGTFDPTPRKISEMFQNDSDGLGDFTTTYIFGNGSCDQIDLTVTVVASQDAIAGTIEDATACTAQGTLDLFSLLTDSNISGGTFSNENGMIANGVFDVSVIGDFNITYTVTESDSATCLNGTDSTEFNLSVTESIVANAGDDSTLTFCSTEESVNLADYLAGNTMPVGVFTGFEDGMFNPAENVGTTTITYTLDYSTDDDVCTTGTDTATFTVTVNEPQDADAGDDIIVSYCEDQTDIVNLRSLLSEANRNRGSFNAPYEDGMFNPSEVGSGVVSIIYTLNGTEDCAIGTDEATITITVNELQNAIAGSIEDATACTAQGTLDLFSLLSSSNISGGTFSNENGVITNGVFDVSSAGDFNITYTVAQSDASTCLNGTDSTDFTVSVSEGDANAGADNSIEVCQAQVDSFSTAQVRSFYLGLLEEGVETNGTFNPTINQIIAQYQQNKIADFTTVYTVGNGACTDSATLTITVNESTVANAGEDVNLTFCSTEGSLNLADYLTDDAAINGVFEGFEDGTFNPANNVGTTTFTYTVDNSIDEDVCTTGTDTATFTITVNEIADANAGGDVTATYCIGQDENVDLVSLLGDDALSTGTFSAPYQNGVFSLIDAEVGVYTITYTVDGAANCATGTDTATITITINNGPDAPIAEANQSFCLIDSPTVGDITITGDNVVIYSDANLTSVVDATTGLVSGMDYYATSTNEAATCSSTTTVINVTITDPAAPTLSFEGNEFCRSDNPTVQDLVNNFTGSGIVIYTSSTGGSAVSATTTLQNGVTYYGASVDGTTACESSERIAVVAKVEFCGIPEGFSPNGDGKNDRFVIPDIAETFPNYSIEIFNRWGNKVFEGNASTGDWDGISNQSGTLGDDVLPVGVYFYILNYNDGQTSPVQGKLYLSI